MGHRPTHRGATHCRGVEVVRAAALYAARGAEAHVGWVRTPAGRGKGRATVTGGRGVRALLETPDPSARAAVVSPLRAPSSSLA